MATHRKSSLNRSAGKISRESEGVLSQSKAAGSDLMARATEIREKIASQLDKIRNDSKLKASAKR